MNEFATAPCRFLHRPVLLTLLCFSASLGLARAADFEVREEAEFKQIVPSGAKLERLATGMKFLEGPVWCTQDGGYLVFSDIPTDELKKWTAKEGLTGFRKPSFNANGNAVDRLGRLLSCEHTGRRVSRREADGSWQTVVDQSGGKKFNSPNDAVVKSDGTIWFTDPPYGLPKGAPKEQDGNYVFRFDPRTKTATVVVKDFDMPNGLCFSPDEKKLYVADSGQPHHIREFAVQRDGTLTGGAGFAVIDKGGAGWDSVRRAGPGFFERGRWRPHFRAGWKVDRQTSRAGVTGQFGFRRRGRQNTFHHRANLALFNFSAGQGCKVKLT